MAQPNGSGWRRPQGGQVCRLVETPQPRASPRAVKDELLGRAAVPHATHEVEVL